MQLEAPQPAATIEPPRGRRVGGKKAVQQETKKPQIAPGSELMLQNKFDELFPVQELKSIDRKALIENKMSLD